LLDKNNIENVKAKIDEEDKYVQQNTLVPIMTCLYFSQVTYLLLASFFPAYA
jgi:hypothetical protein